MTKKEIIARRRIIGAINKIVPSLVSPVYDTRQEARTVLASLREAESLLSLASLAARAAELGRDQEQAQDQAPAQTSEGEQ